MTHLPSTLSHCQGLLASLICRILSYEGLHGRNHLLRDSVW